MPELNPREIRTLQHAMYEGLKAVQEDKHSDPNVKNALVGVVQLLNYISECLVREAVTPPLPALSGPGHDQGESETAPGDAGDPQD